LAGGTRVAQSVGMWVLLSPEIPHIGAPCRGAVGVTPFPLNEMVAGELLALLATETLPLALPVAVGVNATFRVTACPGFSVVLALNPFTL